MSRGNSRVPDITRAVEPDVLERQILRHRTRPWRPPVPLHTQEAFQHARRWRRVQGVGRPLILDSGCGTARSSVALAAADPQALVLGLDKSASRLEKATRRFECPDNLLLLRADCAAFWLLAVEAGWRLRAHYLLYPNPWPKPGHLKRRWHGHPAFNALLALGGRLELRSNWRPYLEEFAMALEIIGAGRFQPGVLQTLDEPLTDFEAKYGESGQTLYRLRADLDI